MCQGVDADMIHNIILELAGTLSLFKPSATRLFALSGRWGRCGPGIVRSHASFISFGWKILHSFKTRLSLLSLSKSRNAILPVKKNPGVWHKTPLSRLKPFFSQENFLQLRNSAAAQAFKSSRFASFRRSPLFLLGFAGVYYSADEEWTLENGMVSKAQSLEAVAQDVRHTIQYFEAMTKKVKRSSTHLEDVSRVNSIDGLVLGKAIAKGCSAVVYPADLKGKGNAGENANPTSHGKFPLAVKIMFNYSVASHAPTILRTMFRETVPAQSIHIESHLSEWEYCELMSRPLLEPHPNIVSLHHVFVDQVPSLPDALHLYPDALPPRINPMGLGRNMSLFLIMQRYDCCLREYLRKGRPSNTTSLIILTQILEGVNYLVSKGVAHRDIKSDNILLDLSHDPLKPGVVITDFGCCLADRDRGLTIPFSSWDTERGGNAALMAPEVACAKPGSLSYLNYKKYDAWAVGAVAYEIFGAENPFYGRDNHRLDSRTYKNEDLPSLNRDAPLHAQNVVFGLLDRNPSARLSAKEAATVCQLLLWAPKGWLDTTAAAPGEKEVSKWLLALAYKIICMPNWTEADPQFDLVVTFLKRVSVHDCMQALRFVRKM